MAVKLYTIAQGDSLSFGVLLNVEYSISNITEAYIWLDGVKFSTTEVGQMFRTVLTSSDTYKHIGSIHVILDILDVNLGRKKIELGHLIVNQTNDFTKDASVNSGYDFVTNLTLTTTSVEVGDTITDYIKGADGNGIVSITLLSTVGLVKTYRILYTDATTFDYTVTDGVIGQDGSTTYTINDKENVSGQVDGITDTFTLTNTPMDLASVICVCNGTVRNVTQLVGNDITLDFVPTSGSTIFVYYKENTTEIPSIENKVDKEIGKSLIADTKITKLDGIEEGANVGVVPNSAITGATKTKITYDSKGLVTGGADATTADIADSTNKRYQTDNQQSFNDATSSIQTQLNAKQASLGYTAENAANKGSNNGYAGLDGGGKVPLSQLPSTLLKYIGQWNASTNTPTLTTPDTSKAGYVYDVSAGGTIFGYTFVAGDWLIYNSSGVPERSEDSNTVLNVNGQTGAVVLTKTDVGLGNVDNTSDVNKPVSTAQNSAIANRNLKSANLSDVASVSTARTNLDVYSKAESDAKVSDSITDGVTTIAPSQNAVFDALAGKAATVHNHSEQSINPDNIIIDKTYTDAEAVALPIGTIFYNSDQADWLLKTSADTYYNFGGEISPLMKNGDSFTHLNGQPVYVFNGNGKLPVVKLADASTELESYTVALATQDVANTGSARGRYCSFGGVDEVVIANVIQTAESSTLWVEGVQLFLSTELGKLTTVAPIAPNHRVLVGYITNKSGSNVSIFVHPNVGAELAELHDVDLTKSKTTPIDADALFLQDSADSNIWKKLTWGNLKTTLQSTFAKLSGGNSFLGTQILRNSNADNATTVLEIDNFSGVLKSSIDGNGNYESFPDYGAEGAPTFAITDWTLTSGWEATNAGGTALDKSSAGTTTATSIGGLTVVSGSVYRVSFTVGDSIGGGAFVSGLSTTFGGNSNPTISAKGTYTYIIRANNANKLVFNPTPTGSRFSITAISIQQITTSVGQVKIGGDLIFGSRMLNSNGIDCMYIYPNGDISYPTGTIRPNSISGGAVTSSSTITGRQFATTTGSSGTTTGSITWTLSTNGNYTLTTALTGTVTANITAPVAGGRNTICFIQGATAQSLILSLTGVTWRQAGVTGSSSNTLTVSNISIVNANYIVDLYWQTTTLCYVTVHNL